MRLVLTMTLLLTACQPAPADDESPPQPTAPSLQSVAPPVAETDATVSPHLWGMNDVGDALMYAPRESDDIHISLRCAPDGKIRIRAFNPAHGGKRLYLASGSESETFSADTFLALQEIVAAARRNLAPGPWAYLVGGTETETTLRRNRQALDSIAFRPRVLNDVSQVDSRASFLGHAVRLPLMLAPVGGMESFVDYGRAFYDNNAGLDKGREFPDAVHANQKRERAEAKAERAAAKKS